MPTYNQVQLQRGKGLTFEEIGLLFGVTRQRIHTIFTGYRLTNKYREKKRHFEQHLIGSNPRKPCLFCEKERN